MGENRFPSRIDVHARQGDLGRDGSVSTIGLARWLEDARLRVRLRRFERLVGVGAFDRFSIILVSQSVERLAPVGRTDANVQVHTGIRHIGRSSFTYEQAVLADGRRVGGGGATIVLAGATGPLTLPDELIADLADLQLAASEQQMPPRPGADRRERGYYPGSVSLRARIGDVDYNEHVNFMALATWYDEAIATLTRKAMEIGREGPVPDLLPWSYRIHYLGEVAYPGDYEIGVLVRSFDADAVCYELGVFQGDECLGVADAVGPRGELPTVALA
ncbi:hypothetical protein [Nonomuraea lactucae]|uniref:acyl-CoA thioesterase n=1 Tax=Nonomuraea lactucae TaxID=2249762 RepID=UPI000DE38844|nr:hypothetical protein [Nonomuraea lactucae]